MGSTTSIRPRARRRQSLLRLALVASLVAAQSSPGMVGFAQQAPPATSSETTPAASQPAVDEGLFYYADGQQIGLRRRVDRIAVATKTDDADPTAAGAALEGFKVDRVVTPGVRLFHAPAASGDLTGRAAEMQAAIAKAEATPGVEWAVPVYVDEVAGGTLVATDEVIVALDRPASPEAFFNGDPRFAGYRPLLGTDDQFVATLADGAGEATIRLANELHTAPGVAWAAPNFYRELQRHGLTNDPRLSTQWHLDNTGQTGGRVDADVDAPEAWDLQTGSPNVVVAVIDDGMEYTHPDLAANVWVNPGEIAGNGIDDDGNGWIDDVRGWDFTGAGDNDPGPSTLDDAHATSVAGIIAAVGNNGIGVAGIAYGSKVMPVRIFLGGSFAGDANAASAIYYAAGRTANGLGTWNAATILNNSWGGGAASSVITAAFTWASTQARGGRGVPSFISSGNDFASSVSYPANLSGTLSGVIAVGASTHTDVRSNYSNYGPQLDVVAPSSNNLAVGGVGTATTDRVGANGYNPAPSPNGDYTTAIPESTGFGGTSSAAPLTAGIGALVLSQNPNLTAAQVRNIMRASTDTIGPLPYAAGFNVQYGYGRVNAFKALNLVSFNAPELVVYDLRGELAIGGTSGGLRSPLGQTTTRTFTVRNAGLAELTLGALSVTPGVFSVQSPPSDTTLALGETATFTVAFTPTTSAPVSATVSLTSNDSNENPFTFTVEGAGVPVSISGHVYEDWDGDGVRESGEPGVAGQSVFLDLDNSGTISSTTFSSTVNAPILDTDTISRTILVAGQGARVGDVDVRVTLTHTYVSDLRLRLISPSGTSVTLIDRRGASGDNLTDTRFDDSAATSIATGSAPFTGTFRPETPLSAINGEAINGTWTLEVADLEAPDAGVLVSWALSISSEEVATTDANGAYSFRSLPTGSYPIRRVLPAGWNRTAPAGDVIVRVVSGIDEELPFNDFGQVRQKAIYGQQFTDVNANGVRDPGEPPAAGWDVFLDSNNNGIVDPPQTFTSAPGLPIADRGVVNATQLVAGGPSSIADLDVTVNATHTWVSDLTLTLISPAGTAVTLVSRRGGSADNLTGTIFDDEAAASVVGGTAPFTGRFRPEQPLSALDEQDANGTWTLRIEDAVRGDAGTLLNWTLSFDIDRVLTTGTSGNFAFTDVPVGSVRVWQVDKSGFARTRPISGSYLVTMTGLNTATEVDFGNVADTTPPTADIVDVTPDPRTTAVGSVSVQFSEPVTGVDVGDFTLTRDGAPVALAGVTLSGGGASYTLNGLSGLTGASGTYALTLVSGASGIADRARLPLVGDASDTWTVTAGGTPRIVGQVVARGPGASTVDVRFTNVGDGTASGVTVNTAAFRTLAGTGTVTLAGPALPIALGTIAPGGSETRTFQLNVPATVTRFVITTGGTYQTPSAQTAAFSSSLAVTK